MGRLFRDESVFDIEYVPERLPHRGKQLKELMSVFSSILERPGKMARRVLVIGDIGTGKTVTTKKFGQLIEEEARKRGVRLFYAHVNCQRLRGSFFHVLLMAMRRIRPSFPERGYAPHELFMNLMSSLEDEDAHMIITLDDAEALMRKSGSSPLYDLSRAHDDRLEGKRRLSLICVVRDRKKVDELDEATKSTLMEYVIEMPRYTSEQLYDILADRVRLGFHEGAIRDDVVRFVAELSARKGDARFAIELLWRAGKLAESEGKREVMPEHVRKALTRVWPIPREVVVGLPTQAKLILLALAREFQMTDEPYLRMGELEDTYRAICEEFGVRPLKHTQTWKYVRELADIGVISAEPSGPGVKGRTTLIGLRIPAGELRKAMEEELSKELGA